MKKILVPKSFYCIKDYHLVLNKQINDLFSELKKSDNQYVINFDYLKFNEFWNKLKPESKTKTFTMFNDCSVLSKIGPKVAFEIENKSEEKIVVFNQNEALRKMVGNGVWYQDLWSKFVLKDISKKQVVEFVKKGLMNTNLEELTIKGKNVKVRRNSIGYFFHNLKQARIENVVALEKYAITSMKCKSVELSGKLVLKIGPQMCVNTLIDISNCKDVVITLPYLHLLWHGFKKESFMRGVDWKDIFVSLCLCPKYKVDLKSKIKFTSVRSGEFYDQYFEGIDWKKYVNENIFDLRNFTLDVIENAVKNQPHQEWCEIDYKIIETVRWYINNVESEKGRLSTKFNKALKYFIKI